MTRGADKQYVKVFKARVNRGDQALGIGTITDRARTVDSTAHQQTAPVATHEAIL